MSWTDPLADERNDAFPDPVDDVNFGEETAGKPGCGTYVGIGIVTLLAIIGGTFMTGVAVFGMVGPFQNPDEVMAVIGGVLSLVGGLIFGGIVAHFLYRWESGKRSKSKSAEEIFEHFAKK